MVKRIAITAIVLACFATAAHADHWRATSSLLPGTYMLVYMSMESTAAIHDMYDSFAEQGVAPASNIVWTGYAVAFNFDETYNTPNLIEFMMAGPPTTPGHIPVLFKKDKIGWHQIEMPCKWTLGDAAM